MKDILVIAHFTHVPGEKGNSRFNYLANMLSDNNLEVEVVTTSFSHRTKKSRNLSDNQLKELKYKLTMLEEKGYRKNISIRRFYSHFYFGKELNNYLKNRKKPDIIYCAVPSLDAAYHTAKYARENEIRLIIDIQDLWPEAFNMVFDVPIISKIIFRPMVKRANYIYASADEIVAVSQTYLNRALMVNKKTSNKGHNIFLGTDLKYFDRMANKYKFNNKPKNEIWLAYIGTLGYSYDLIKVMDALKELKINNGIENIKFIVMGDGPLRSKFEKHAIENDIYSDFTGRLDYGVMVGLLKECDIAVNPIRSGAAASIINKVGDYSAAGLPVLNTQESEEYRDLVVEYNIGINCTNDKKDITEGLLKLYKDINSRKIYSNNSRRLAEDLFDREKTYKKVLSLLN